MDNTVKQKFREYLALHYQEQDLCSWFDPLALSINEEERSMTVSFPHTFFATWFANGPQAIFTCAVHDFFGQHYRVLYGQNSSHKKLSFDTMPSPLHILGTKHSMDSVEKSQNTSNIDTTLPSMDIAIKNASIGHCVPKKTVLGASDTNKNTRFTNFKTGNEQRFDTFIVNHKNTFPLTTAREAAVASRTRRYNPVLICGESGHGKSHLLNAMAHDLALAMGPASVYCASITDIESLYAQTDKLVIRQHLMQREAFLLDDIHLLCDLPHLHHELICLFDAFLAAHKQMAFTCTGRLTLVHNLSPALRSRLELGLILHLKEPDVDVRARFIQKQCAHMDIKLSREQIMHLAQRCPSFRHIMGILVKISAYTDMVQHDVADYEFEKLLRHAESGRERKLSHGKIIEIVSEYFNMSASDILGNKRHKNIVFARQIAMFLCRELLGCSFPTLGQYFNGKDHSTTIYSFNKINKLQHDSKDTHKLVTALKKLCINHESDKP